MILNLGCASFVVVLWLPAQNIYNMYTSDPRFSLDPQLFYTNFYNHARRLEGPEGTKGDPRDTRRTGGHTGDASDTRGGRFEPYLFIPLRVSCPLGIVAPPCLEAPFLTCPKAR